VIEKLEEGEVAIAKGGTVAETALRIRVTSGDHPVKREEE